MSASVSNSCGTSCRLAASMVVCRKSALPWVLARLPLPEMTNSPFCTSRDFPVRCSSARQISFERRASGVYCTPSPQASRVMRVSPWLEPKACGGVNWSRPRTLAPRLASWKAVAEPMAPRPMTITSNVLFTPKPRNIAAPSVARMSHEKEAARRRPLIQLCDARTDLEIHPAAHSAHCRRPAYRRPTSSAEVRQPSLRW